MKPNVYMIMSVARSQAVAANVEPPHVWYCTHLLGGRICVVANRGAMELSPTWPGDLITDDAAVAEEWLSAPPVQHELGIAPAKLAAPPDAQPAPPVKATAAIVGIRWWVNMARQPPDVWGKYNEVRRSRDHAFVELTCLYGSFDAKMVCGCGRALIAVECDECPEGIGCAKENEHDDF